MHEMSIALEVCRITEEYVRPTPLSNVVEVAMEVGDEAGIEIENLEFCLEALLASPPFGRAKPVIQRSRGDVLRVIHLEVEDDGPED